MVGEDIRIKLLVDAFLASLPKEEKPGLPEGEPTVSLEYKLPLVAAIKLHRELLAEGPNRGPDYAYHIFTAPYSDGALSLRWWGREDHPRLKELRTRLEQLLRAVQDVFWEDMKAEEVRQELRKMPPPPEVVEYDKTRTEILRFYEARVPWALRPLLNNLNIVIAEDYIYIQAPQELVGHLIGKGGAKVKELSQQLKKQVIIRSSG